MRILITGANGQVGWELRRSMLPVGQVIAPDRTCLDLSDISSICGCVDACRPDIIVNAAAYTAVDRAETEQDLATRVNAEAVGALAEAAKRHAALILHYSTDYVFDGAKSSPYLESDRPAPVSAYGRSKLEGERALAAVGCDYLCLRTSWVYASRGKNFLLTMLKLGAEREELRVVNDQHGSPTWARFIADASSQIATQAIAERANGEFRSEILHLASSGGTTWHGFAQEILRRRRESAADVRVRSLTAISTAEYPTPARRPRNSRLACDRVMQRYSIVVPAWETCVELCLAELAQ